VESKWLVEVTIVALAAILFANAHLIYDQISGLVHYWDIDHPALTPLYENYYFYVDYSYPAANALWCGSAWTWLRRAGIPPPVSIILLTFTAQYTIDAYSVLFPIDYKSIPWMLGCLVASILIAWGIHLKGEYVFVRRKNNAKIGFKL